MAARFELSSAQKRFLRGSAHALRATLQVGKAGVTEAWVADLDRQLASRELVKIRFLGNLSAEEKSGLLDEASQRLGASTVGSIGHVAVLYRPHPEPGKRRFEARLRALQTGR